MRMLITGGAGFLGSHLVDRALARDDVSHLEVVDNLWTGDWRNLDHISDKRLHRVTGDVEQYKNCEPFDEIVHLASPASPKWYMGDPARTISANLIGAMNLLSCIKPEGKFSYTSTSEVYGDPRVTPQSEKYLGSVDCTGPRASYDESKRCTEALLFEMKRTRGLNIRIARIFNAYGPRTRNDDGRAVSNFITAALAGRPIEIYGTGEQTRSWGYVDDIVDGLAAFFFDEKVTYPGPLNIGNEREASVLATAEYVQSMVPGAQITFCPATPDDPSNRRPDMTLAQEILPYWRCTTSYEVGIAKTLEWFRQRM